MESSCLENAASQRASYTAAYASLEQAIRNFGKEKLVYEQKIADYKASIEMGKENLQKLHLEHQDMIAENKRLCNLHDEDEKDRLALDTLIASLERKQDLIVESFQSFENCEQEMCQRNETYEEFLYSLKYRQIQLLEIIDETNKQKEVLRDEANFKCNALMNEVQDAKCELQKAKSNFIQEKAAICQGHEDSVQILMGQLKASGDLLLEERNARQLQQIAQEKLQDSLDLLSVKLSEEKALMLQKQDEYSKEKDVLINTHKMEIDQLTAEINGEKALTLQTLDGYSKEKDVLINTHKMEIDQLTAEINEEKALTLQKLDEYSKEKEALISSHQMEIDQLTAELNEEKALMLQKQEEYSKDKEALISSHKSELDHLSAELDKEKTLMLQKLDEYSKEKEALISSHKSELDILSTELNQEKTLTLQKMDEYSKEKEALITSHKLECENLEKRKELQFSEEKEALGKTHKKAMAELDNEFSKCKAETRALYKRYQDQKQAISKLVDETGVRPVSLPSTATCESKTASKPTLSQEKLNYVETTPRNTPMSSGRKLMSSSLIDANQRGILKRSISTIPDKNKSVTFGQVSVADFFASSSDSESGSSGELYQPNKDKEVIPVSKRAKFGNEKQEQIMEKENPEEKQKNAEKPKRFIKQRGGIPRVSV